MIINTSFNSHAGSSPIVYIEDLPESLVKRYLYSKWGSANTISVWRCAKSGCHNRPAILLKTLSDLMERIDKKENERINLFIHKLELVLNKNEPDLI
jgi:hypothetical protein